MLGLYICISLLLAMVFFILGMDEDGLIKRFFISIFGGAFFGLIAIGIIVMGGQSRLETKEVPWRKYELVTLDSRESTEGKFQSFFFVGSGYIGEELYYHFYIDTPDGIKYQKERAEGSSIFIKECECEPYYLEYNEKYVDSTSIFYQDGFNYSTATKRVLYIPKGTIKRDFKVN